MFILPMIILLPFFNLNLRRSSKEFSSCILPEFTGLFSLGSVQFPWVALIKMLSKSLHSSYHKVYLLTKLIKLFAKKLLPILFRYNPL